MSSKTEQIQRIEAALGKARVSDANPCGAVVTAESNGTWTIADDWVSENYQTFYGALQAAKMWAGYTPGSVCEY